LSVCCLHILVWQNERGKKIRESKKTLEIDEDERQSMKAKQKTNPYENMKSIHFVFSFFLQNIKSKY